MTNRTIKWIYAASSLVMAALLVVVWIGSQSYSSSQLCEGIYVEVVDSANQKFVTAAELKRELGRLPDIARRTPVKSINTDSLERQLRVIDKIESVRVIRLTNGALSIIVEPMRPIARVFDTDRSYYINKDGKRISAVARYHVDVPVIMGHFSETDTSFTPVKLIPLLDFIKSSERWNQLVTMIKADGPNDIFIIPPVKGIVFNLGSLNNLAVKFGMLERMIDEVIPVAGWEHYDTISVKWRGQIVATRRLKERPDTVATVEEVREKDDLETMSVGTNIAPGQALPGKKAKSEKPVPGAAKEEEKTKKTSENNNTNNNNTPTP